MADQSTLNVSLTSELASFVAAKVDNGQYRSASEVVRASLRLLDRYDPATPASAMFRHLPYSLGETAASGNRLLCALPPSDLQQLQPLLTRVPLKVKSTLYHAGLPIEHVYFVGHGLASVVSNGSEITQGVEAYVIGPEGMVGLPVVLGVAAVPHRCIVQAEGEALCISAADLRQAMTVLPSFRTVLLRHANHALLQASQAAICNARHDVPERLARWLLMAHDRLERDDLPFTHDMLGKMLGVRRASVSAMLPSLVAAGAITCERHHVHVHDRDKLEQLSCSCYRVLKPAFLRAGTPVNGAVRSDLLLMNAAGAVLP